MIGGETVAKYDNLDASAAAIQNFGRNDLPCVKGCCAVCSSQLRKVMVPVHTSAWVCDDCGLVWVFGDRYLLVELGRREK